MQRPQCPSAAPLLQGVARVVGVGGGCGGDNGGGGGSAKCGRTAAGSGPARCRPPVIDSTQTVLRPTVDLLPALPAAPDTAQTRLKSAAGSTAPGLFSKSRTCPYEASTCTHPTNHPLQLRALPVYIYVSLKLSCRVMTDDPAAVVPPLTPPGLPRMLCCQMCECSGKDRPCSHPQGTFGSCWPWQATQLSSDTCRHHVSMVRLLLPSLLLPLLLGEPCRCPGCCCWRQLLAGPPQAADWHDANLVTCAARC